MSEAMWSAYTDTNNGVGPPSISYRRTRSEDQRSTSRQLQQQQQQIGGANRYKTELCRPYQEYGHCRYGDKCQFAHGKNDLRTPIRHPKYKTELCRTYHSQGYCPYGARCHFIHSTIEARPASATARSTGSGTNFITFQKPPSSPSQDSGISSPGGTPSFFPSNKAFDYPPYVNDTLSDDQDDASSCLWKVGSGPENTNNGFDWDDNMSNESISPIKQMNSFDGITEKLSTTSLDDGWSNGRPRLPIFNKLNSFSDTALCSKW